LAGKVIGIIGGMGPDATLDLYAKIINTTRLRGARCDQDHLEVVISSIPQTPDRTGFILGRGPSPLPELLRSARRLESAGAELLAIACITAHHFLRDISSAVAAPVLDAPALTADWITRQHPDAQRAGIIATDGTLATRLLHSALEKVGIDPIEPDREIQREVMDAIYGRNGIKSQSFSDDSVDKIRRASDYLIEQGASVIIAGCTEIPLVLKSTNLASPLIDPTTILAEAAVDTAMGTGMGDV